MEITQALLTVSKYNRPGTKRANTTAIACHYIGNPGTSATANRNYFESLKNGLGTSASCHFIIGLQGEVLQLIPENEISYCTNSANSYTISIEACHPDSTGAFNTATYEAYIELCADLCTRWGLDPLHGGLIRHYDVTGKKCPLYFVNVPSAWEAFKLDVSKKMVTDYTIGWNRDDDGWWYADTVNTYYKSTWKTINGHKYYFNAHGYAFTGWHQIGGDWYYFEPTVGDDYECALYVTNANGVQAVGKF